MATIALTPKQLGPELRARARRTPGELTKAMLRSARQGQALLVRRTPKDLGQAKAGWRVSQPIKGTKGARVDLYNDNPYVGVLEEGARPHPVNMEGRIAIYEWVRRHYAGMRKMSGPLRPGEKRKMRRPAKSGAEKEILDITNAIIQKIRKKGQKGTHFVKNSMDDLVNDFSKNVNKQITDYSRRRAKRGVK